VRRIVADTNVIVSALLIPGSICDVILQLVLNNKVELAVCHKIVTEYQEVLGRPKFEKIAKPLTDTFFDYLKLNKTKRIEPPPTPEPFDQDPDDKIFYDLSIEADATLVTGNKKHFPNANWIVTPTQFIEDYSRRRE
jgi:putative PIN family toxin of toxin-antitoxin system